MQRMKINYPRIRIELRIEAETDRVYHGVKRPLSLQAWQPQLDHPESEFPDVVVWKPWVERCAAPI